MSPWLVGVVAVLVSGVRRLARGTLEATASRLSTDLLTWRIEEVLGDIRNVEYGIQIEADWSQMGQIWD